MSQADVELVARLFESYGGNDYEATLEFFTEDVVWRTGGMPDVQVVHGHDGLRSLNADLEDSFEDFRMDPGQLEDHGKRVLAEVHQSGRGRGSGVEVKVRYWLVVTTREGLVAQVEAFLDETEARASADA